MKPILSACLLILSLGGGLPAAARPRTPKAPAPRAVRPAVPSLEKTASGLQLADMAPGTGESPATGQTCSMLYRGWLYVDGKRGKLFDQNQDRKHPFTFKVGTGQVIKGWDEGVGSMKKGGKRVLVIPPALAYGDRDMGEIPPGSTLLFEVELLGFK